MSLCSTPIISSINPNECIGSSLGKINTNFTKLQESICDLSGNTIHEIDSPEIDLHWDPTTRILSATLQSGSDIPNSKLAKMPPWTVKGNSTSTTASPQDIQATSCTILGMRDPSSPVLDFKQLVNCQIEDRTIQTEKIKQNTLKNDVFADDVVDNRVLSAMPPYTVKGNATGTYGVDPQDIYADPFTVLARPSAGNLEWIKANTDTALIRSGTAPLSFVQASDDSVLMKDQSTLRFVTAVSWSAYVKPNAVAPLQFTFADEHSVLMRSPFYASGNVQFNKAAQNSVLLRDNTDLRFVEAPINTVIARDETTLRPISAQPYSAFIRPGPTETGPDDRLQFRVAEPNSALIRTNTQNLSFAFAPENSALLRMKNDHLRHVVSPSNTALIMTKGQNSGSTGVESLSFTPAPLGTVLRRKHKDLTDESNGGTASSPGTGNEALDFGKISYDMFDWNSGPVGVGTVCMFYPTISGTTVSDYFDTQGLGKINTVYEGWAICNGNTYEISVQVEDGSLKVKTFVTPDLRCKFVLSTSWNGNLHSLTSRPSAGTMGGEEKHKLTIPELARHKHDVEDIGHTHPYRGGKEAKADSMWGDDSKSDDNGEGETHQTQEGWANITEKYVGNDVPHNNMPPFYTLFYIIKIYSGKQSNGEILVGPSSAPFAPTPTPTPTPTATGPAGPPWSAIWTNFTSGLDSSKFSTRFKITTNTTTGLETIIGTNLWLNNGTAGTNGNTGFTSFTSVNGAVGGSLNLATASSLQNLVVTGQSLDALSVPTSIKNINCSNNKITTLTPAQFSGIGSLLTLNVNNNEIAQLNLASSTLLTDLKCDGNSTLTNLTVPSSLANLECRNCNITTLSLNGNTNITQVACDGNSAFITLDITGCSNLQKVGLQSANVQNVSTNAATFTKLYSIDMGGATLQAANSATVLANFFYNVLVSPPGAPVKKLAFPSSLKWSSLPSSGAITPLTRYATLTANNWAVSPLYS